MAAERLTMRKLKEIFRLLWDERKSAEFVAQSVGCGRTTVREYLDRASRAGVTSWGEIEEWSEADFENRLFSRTRQEMGMRIFASQHPLPDWVKIHAELSRAGVTLQLLWQEYHEQYPDGFKYSRFAELYALWRKKLSVVMRQSHRSGEKAFVDYCDGLWLLDPKTGIKKRTQLFVGALGASSYIYAEASETQALPHWLLSHVRMYEYFQGVPELTVPDNLKAGVKNPCYYDPEINPSYRDLARHYGTVVLPTRVRKPRDKATAEVSVLVAQRWILAVLRDRVFTSIHDMNQAISGLLAHVNSRVMRHLGKSRKELWETLDRPALKELPAVRYEYAAWAKPRLNIDYHVEYEHHFYSAPYKLIHQRLDLRATGETIELFLKGVRVASHVRSYIRGRYTTDPAHRPEGHRAHSEWSPERMKAWAGQIGPKTAEVVGEVFRRKEHPEQAYRSVLGLIRLGKRFGPERLEKASIRSLEIGSPSYRTIFTMLKNKMESAPLGSDPQGTLDLQSPGVKAQTKLAKADHALVRGKGYYH